MKKQISIFAATIITVAFISCSKEKTSMSETSAVINEEIVTSSSSNRVIADPLANGLAGSFKFEKNLKDDTRRLSDGQAFPVIRGVPIYTHDRKGKPNAALKFDGKYYVSIENVPVQQNISLSVWVKRTDAHVGTPPIIRHNSTGIALMQDGDAFWGRVFSYLTSETSSIHTNNFNDGWHHIVITYSANEMVMYVDGQLQQASTGVFTITEVVTNYLLGYGYDQNGKYWKGIIDDLRFYTRTLSATEVQVLYNL